MKDINCWEAKFTSCVYTDRLLGKLLKLNEGVENKINLTEVRKAIYYAKKYHGNQKRQSGEPYYTHPLEVAFMVSDYSFKTDALVTSILHDTIEDTELTEKMMECIFGNTIARQVEALTRVKINKKISSAELIELLREQKKHDLLVIKLLDRLHNMRTIQAKSSEHQKRTILETAINFLPMAAYLSLLDIEKSLAQSCFNVVSKEFHARDEGEAPGFEEEDYQPLSREFQNAE